MDQRSRQLYTPAITGEFLHRFAIESASIKELDGFESFIYEVEKDGRPFILRISHNLHNSPERVRAEMEFLDYLIRNELRVPGPQKSIFGEWVETIPAPSPELPDSVFSAALFTKAPGRPPRRGDWTPEFCRAMGAFLGRLHSLSRQYVPQAYRRHEWYEDQEDYIKYLPEGQERVIEQFNQLISHLKSLPCDADGYGLAHLDFHGGNFFIEQAGAEPGITLFDFDDCAYAPYIYDIAMALFYVVPHHCETPEGLETAHTFLNNFMEGYNREYRLAPEWFTEIPNFLKLREFDLYMVLYRSTGPDDLGPWASSFMEGRRERLENGVPFIPMDFPPGLAD